MSDVILQTRYDFYHDKRMYKLTMIYDIIAEEKRYREAQRELKLIEKRRKQHEEMETAELDSRVQSGHRPQRTVSGVNINQLGLPRKSSQFVDDYAQPKQQLGMPAVARENNNSRMIGKRAFGSNMNVGNMTPKGSSMNVIRDLSQPARPQPGRNDTSLFLT